MKTLRQIVQELEAGGLSVTFRERVDGSIIITNLGGQSFLGQGAAGNIAARKMAGATLSPAQVKQMKEAFTVGGYGPGRKQLPLDDETMKLLRKAQRAWRGHKKPGHGTVTKKRVRQLLDFKTVEQVNQYLKEEYRVAKGWATEYKRGWLAGRIRNAAYIAAAEGDDDSGESLKEIADYIEGNEITQDDFDEVNEIMYSVEEYKMTAAEGVQQIDGILGKSF